MDFRPDISFEYDYIRIVYEVILSNLRTNKKVVEKDLNTVVLRLQNLKKKQGNMQDIALGVKNLITKVQELERKVSIVNLTFSTTRFAKKRISFMTVFAKG